MADDVEWSEPDIEGAIAAALLAGGEKLRDESNKLSPNLTGEMDAGAYVEVGTDYVEVGYTAPYARRQHESLGLKHPNGGQAKFLELAAVREGDKILQAMAEAYRAAAGGR